MSIRIYRNPLSILLAIQVVVILSGTLAVTGMLKLSGYEDGYSGDKDWNDLTIFIRNWGLTGLLIPLAWALVLMKISKTNGSFELSKPNLISAIIVTLFFVWIYFTSVFSAALPRIWTALVSVIEWERENAQRRSFSVILLSSPRIVMQIPFRCVFSLGVLPKQLAAEVYAMMPLIKPVCSSLQKA